VSLLDKKPARKCCVLTEETLDEIEARAEHITEITVMPHTRDQHVKIISSNSYKAA
jgi:hypothetical protein